MDDDRLRREAWEARLQLRAVAAEESLREAWEARQRLAALYAEEARAESRRSAMARFAILVAVLVLIVLLFLAYQWYGVAVTLSLVGLVGGLAWLCGAVFTLLLWRLPASSDPGDSKSPAAIRYRRLNLAASSSIVVAIGVIAISLVSYLASY